MGPADVMLPKVCQVREIPVGSTPIDVVERVVRIDPELEREPLMEPEVLRQRRVEVDESRTVERIPGGVAVGVKRRHRERIAVDARISTSPHSDASIGTDPVRAAGWSVQYWPDPA